MNPERKIRIGITGQPGFIGTHLYNYFGTKMAEVIRIPCEDEFFDDAGRLRDFVSQCDTIIHLAALNRHHDPQVIYDTNIRLVEKLITAMEDTKSTPHVFFASSTQEERENMFGLSKREGRRKLSQWAAKNGALFTGLIIPNVYGSFGSPYYNSVVATFCHQVTHDEQPVIEIDANLKLIYIQELVAIIWKTIVEKRADDGYKIPHSIEKKVSEIYALIKAYATQYLQQGIIPEASDDFEYNLFNSFMNYNAVQTFYPVKYGQNKDNRGRFVELMKTVRGGQVSFSTTKPGITRGNHYHTRKIERFAVIKGKATIRLRRIGTDKIMQFDLDGNEPAYVDIPIWHTHNISNRGDDELYTVFWINEFYNAEDPDTYYLEV
ncbi:MAG: NAD-dependent epimerase/dehydratase family protein [Marinilabiliaceae bacterium]|nr:NAD-dependent epimerase/dehydratase family protein [Marinilabiliaceae bacterium]